MMNRKLRPAPVRVFLRPRLRTWEVGAYCWIAGFVAGMVTLALAIDMVGG